MAISKEHLLHPKYRPDIDGLRAFAVLSVVLYHAFPSKIEGGFVGVDIFFVISGYLISTIIFTNLERGTFSFAEFYIRRVKRIFPALLLVLFLCFIFGWYALLEDEFKQLGKHIFAGAGFVSNFVLWSESGYFDNIAESKPLLHLWSLGIEEQFYIIWPLLIWLAWKSKLGLLLITLGVFLVSFSLNIYGIGNNAVATFYSPLTRFWELSAGGLLAYLTLHKHINTTRLTATQSNTVSIVGFVLLLLALFLTKPENEFPGWWALLPVAGSMLMIAAGTTSWLNNKIFSNKLAVWFGLISFPLYLWHWPLLSFARIIEGTTPDRLIRGGLVLSAVLLAYLTYELIEKPLRFGSGSRRKIMGLSVSMIMLGVAGAGVYKFESLSNTRLSSSVDPQILKAIGDWEYPGDLKKVRTSSIDIFVNQSVHPEVVLFGDSHIEQYGPRVMLLTNDGKSKDIAFFTNGGCPPIPGVYTDLHQNCRGFTDKFQEFLHENKSVKTILIGACWNCYFIAHTSLLPASDDKHNYYYQDGEHIEKFRGGLGKDKSLLAFRDFVKKLSTKYSVYVLLDNPSGKEFNPSEMLEEGGSRHSLTFSFASKNDVKVIPNTFPRDGRQTLLENEMKLLLEDLGVVVLEQSELICPINICASFDSLGRPIYRDGNHIRPFYIREKMDVIDSIIIK